MQGAGMVNLDGAINTSVYLEGMDLNGKAIGKSKIALRNNADIAKGDIKLSFIAHNESDEDLSFDATLVVMRPAKIEANLVLSKDYSFSGEVDSLSKISGLSYWDYLNERQETVDGTPKYKEVIKITRVLEYYQSKADYEAGRKVVLQTGYYYNASSSTFDWQPLPNSSYQSVQDVELARISGQKVTAKANSDTTITINPYSLTKEQKDTILSIFEYGCMIEGYVLLDSKNLTQPDLSIPYLGFYSGSDVDASRSYASPAVFEPFNFEKDINKVYPSYLVNDITKSLLGKDNVNFESMWLAGYIENPTDILTDNVLSNDSNFTLLQGFHTVGIDPYTGEKSADGKIYVGSPEKTNTMIIQQFMLRSVSDNYFTITNKSTQQVVYSSALEDMLFGDQNGKHELYKSHVDGNYLSSGYVAHRAYARVPLYDTTTGEAFKDGDYEVTFNYLLAGTNTWVNKTYEICIDSSSPEIKDISTYYNNKNEQKVKFEFKDRKVSYVVIGNTRLPVEFNATDNTYFVEVDKKFVDDEIGFIGQTRAGQSRLFIKVVDAAYGEMSAIVHFDLNNDNSFNFNSYQMVYGTKLAVNNDFKIKNNTVSFISIDPSGKETNMEVPCTVNYKSRAGTNPVKPASGGCNGSIVDLSITITITSLLALTLLLIVRKKKYERN